MSVATINALRKRDSHIWEREANEHYVEPEWVSSRLFEEEIFFGNVWDPACGFGRIVMSARQHGLNAQGTDLVNRGFGTGGVDFLSWNSGGTVHNIVTNPPFKLAEQFALRALKLAERKVALVLPSATLNAAHWLKGLPLLNVWLLTPRPSMPPGHVIASGQKPQGGRADFYWVVFRKQYEGPSYLRWLRRDK